MRPITRRLYATVALAATMTGVSCADAGSPPLGPQASVLSEAPAHPYVLRAVPAAAETAVLVVDAGGGVLRAGGHMLIVPGNAVSQPTEFTMTVLPGLYIQVDLSARLVSDGAVVTRFASELQLKLDYRDGIVANDRRLAVAYLVDDTTLGRRQRMPGSVDAVGRFVTAELTHFSTYAMIVD